MDFERTLETQRLKLLRIVAGLFVLVGILSVGPLSRGFSGWVCGFVGSILSRAEVAARYLVIAQAGSMLARGDRKIDRRQFSDLLARAVVTNDADGSLFDYRERLKVLRGVLMDLARHAARLIRRIEKHLRRTGRADRKFPRLGQCHYGSLHAWRLPETRVERPPDKRLPPPPFNDLPRISGWEALVVRQLFRRPRIKRGA